VEDQTPGEPVIWRADFAILPDQNYVQAGYDEFLSWVERHSHEIAQGPQKVRISLETELEDSTAQHPRDWISFTNSVRARLSAVGLNAKIPLGIQPNWYPWADPGPADCSDYRTWIGSLDFLSPSMYGDWSHVDQGFQQAPSRIQEVLDRLTRTGHSCEVPEFASKPYGFGEIGISAVLEHTEQWTPPSAGQVPTFLQQREFIYSNVLTWMKSQLDFSSAYPVINVWALGIYDPAGIDGSATAFPDKEIIRSIQEYKAWRCN
jgi:hypothetical protein